MANHLDLEEQEQLDQLKHFWKRFGNIISWTLIAVMAAFAGWNLYQRWQVNQSSQAAAMYEEFERVVRSGDVSKLDRVFSDMRDKFPASMLAQQAGLLSAKVYFEAGKTNEAKAALEWVASRSSDPGYKAIAKLRLVSVSMQARAFDDALQQIGGEFPSEFTALVADRKGDILTLQGKKTEARIEYEKAFRALDERTEYRRLVEVKLNAIGVNPLTSQDVLTPEGKK